MGLLFLPLSLLVLFRRPRRRALATILREIVGFGALHIVSQYHSCLFEFRKIVFCIFCVLFCDMYSDTSFFCIAFKFPPPPPSRPPPPSPRPSTTRTVSSYTFVQPKTVGPPPPQLDNQGTVFFFFFAATMMVIELDHMVAGWRTLTPHKGNDRIAQREYGKAPTRQLRNNTYCCLWSGHTKKQSNTLALSSVSKKVSTKCAEVRRTSGS